MVVYINRNLILNSDNVCYAKIVADEKGFTNKMQIALVGGENIEVEFSSVGACKKCFEHIASAIHGGIVHLDFGKSDDEETRLFYTGIHMVK